MKADEEKSRYDFFPPWDYQFKIYICEDWMEKNYLLTFVPNSEENPKMTDRNLM